ncbi:MAG: hypothetical protein E6Q50_08305 [Lysobacter sp.]|nr:MAG: hypothetical protein E6Q50_08305 [Lysobacter sp.]
MTAKQRGDIARTLVAQWAEDVRKQGGDVRQWATKLGRFVGTADVANLRQALDMPTYTTMMAVLQGQPVASKSVQKALAQAADVGIESLGSAIADTTYTPLPNGRCRVADSRVIASPLTGGVARNIDTEDISSYAAQGGNGTFANGDGSANCGIPSLATALAVSVTVLSTGNEGFFKIYENGKPFQTGSTVYYTGAVSASNDVIVTSCQSCAVELAIYASSGVNYVIDVVGYFMPPQATNLQCTQTALQSFTVAAGDFTFFNNPLCPTGYHEVMPYCYSGSAGVYSQGSGVNSNTAGLATFCAWQNTNSTSRTVYGGSICCRVPGR